MRNDMTLTDMRYLVALASERHFGRAADKCHVSQPTLSVAIKKVEEALSLQLFERSSAEVRVTQIGEEIIAQIKKILQEVAYIDEIVTAGKDPLVGVLKLGVIYTIAPYLLPKLIGHVHHLAPQMPLQIEENYTSRLLDALKQGALDVIVAALPLDEPGIVSMPIYDEPFRVLLPSEHSWGSNQAIAPQDLAQEKLLLLSAGNCFRDQVLKACAAYQSHSGLQRTLEGSSLETIRHMVATGLGITVLPSSAADDPVSKNPLVQVKPFSEPEPFRTVAIAWRVTYPRNKAIDIIRSAIEMSALPGVYWRKRSH